MTILNKIMEGYYPSPKHLKKNVPPTELPPTPPATIKTTAEDINGLERNTKKQEGLTTMT